MEVELGLLDHLDLGNAAVLDWIDGVGCFRDVSSNRIRKEFLDKFRDVAVGNLSGDDLGHSLSDLFDLLRLSVSGFFHLVSLSLLLGESGDKHSQMIVVGGFNINVALDSRLPFLDHRAHLVTGQAHTVEVEHAVLALNIFADELEFSVTSAVLVQVGLVAVVNATFETVSGDLVTDGFGDESLANLAGFEDGRRTDIVPIFFGEWVDDLLLTALFGAFGETFIFSYGHAFLFLWFSNFSVSST